MSLNDPIEADSEDAQTGVITPETARRQLNMSAGLAGVLCTVALALALFWPPPVRPARHEASQSLVQAPQLVHIRHAEGSVRLTPGG